MIKIGSPQERLANTLISAIIVVILVVVSSIGVHYLVEHKRAEQITKPPIHKQHQRHCKPLVVSGPHLQGRCAVS